MPKPTKPTANNQDTYETTQEALDPHRREERQRAMMETSEQLRNRGVSLTGQESSEELVALLEAVERFEHEVEVRGGDLMVDEGPHGATREPDDVHFVLPRREPREPVVGYLERLEDARRSLRRHRPHGT